MVSTGISTVLPCWNSIQRYTFVGQNEKEWPDIVLTGSFLAYSYWSFPSVGILPCMVYFTCLRGAWAVVEPFERAHGGGLCGNERTSVISTNILASNAELIPSATQVPLARGIEGTTTPRTQVDECQIERG